MNLLLEEINLPEGSYTERYNGLVIYFENSATEKDKAKTYKLLKYAERLLKSKNIKPLNNFVKDIVILNSNEVYERFREDNKEFAGLYFYKEKSIMLSLYYPYSKQQYSDESLLNTLIHELGHAIHMNYIDKDSETYWNDISSFFMSSRDKLEKVYQEVDNLYFDTALIKENLSKEEIISNFFTIVFDFLIADYFENKKNNIFTKPREEVIKLMKKKGLEKIIDLELFYSYYFTQPNNIFIKFYKAISSNASLNKIYDAILNQDEKLNFAFKTLFEGNKENLFRYKSYKMFLESEFQIKKLVDSQTILRKAFNYESLVQKNKIKFLTMFIKFVDISEEIRKQLPENFNAIFAELLEIKNYKKEENFFTKNQLYINTTERMDEVVNSENDFRIYHELCNRFMLNLQVIFKKLYQTEYASTNEKEDFAETFADYIVNTGRLSQWNYNRITSTLKKAKAKGKSIFIENKDLNILKNYVKILMESKFIK